MMFVLDKNLYGELVCDVIEILGLCFFFKGIMCFMVKMERYIFDKIKFLGWEKERLKYFSVCDWLISKF